MDRLPTDLSDDVDLDALMIRVREAAMATGTRGGAARPHTDEDAKGADIDLVRVIDAQGEWNEHTRQSLAALVECLRTLRDDWTDAHARLRVEMGHLSALVEQLRSATSPALAPPSSPAQTPPRTRRAAASPRGTSKRRPAAGRRPRS